MVIYFIIALAIITRFIPHMPNAAPVTALAIFGAAYLPKKQAIAIPLAVRFISDIYLGFFQWPLMVAVYASHLVGVLFGLWIRKSIGTIPTESHHQKFTRMGRAEGSVKTDFSTLSLRPIARNGKLGRWAKILGSSMLASIIFFLVTNFAFFYPYYLHNISGIIAAYTNGLPFLRGTVFGDLGYTVALFGGYEFAMFIIRKKSESKVLQKLA